MTRRELLAASLACGAMPALARANWDKSRLSAITDEIGNTVDESIAFAHRYGLTFVEIRDHLVTGGQRKEYFKLNEAEIRADALRFKREGLKVSFVNTSLMKFTWPGMETPRRRPEEPDARDRRLANEKAMFDQRLDDLRKAIRCAQWMDCDKVRVFTGNRIQEPASVFPRVAEVIAAMAEIAAKEKVYLLLENEGSQNMASSTEIAALMDMLPSKWVNFTWDPHNAIGMEKAYPDAYSRLPMKRLMNVQVKAYGILPDSPQKQDWRAIMKALDKDGYKGKIALETHVYDGTLIEKAHLSMQEMVSIVRELG